MEGHGRRFESRSFQWECGSHAARKPLEALARIMEIRNPEIAAHGRDVAALVTPVGRSLGLSWQAFAEVELAACFHDIGKAAVPDEVLLKPGPLDRREWRVMACHPEWGASLVRHLPDCATIALAIRHHHESWDGSGYPEGLAGRDIPRASRIVSVCDAYAAMLADRSYRPALSADEARCELRQSAGTKFDPEVVSALLGARAPGLTEAV